MSEIKFSKCQLDSGWRYVNSSWILDALWLDWLKKNGDRREPEGFEQQANDGHIVLHKHEKNDEPAEPVAIENNDENAALQHDADSYNDNIKIVEIDPTFVEIDPTVKDLLKKFRYHKEKDNAAIVMKINPDELLVIKDENYEYISVDDLVDQLPDHLPRYLAFSYVLNHDDGRVPYPLCFIFINPLRTKPPLQAMYAASMKLQRNLECRKSLSCADSTISLKIGSNLSCTIVYRV